MAIVTVIGTQMNIVMMGLGVNSGVWGSWLQRFWGGGVVGSPWNIIIPYNVQEYEMKNTFQSGDFSEIERLVYIK